MIQRSQHHHPPRTPPISRHPQVSGFQFLRIFDLSHKLMRKIRNSHQLYPLLPWLTQHDFSRTRPSQINRENSTDPGSPLHLQWAISTPWSLTEPHILDDPDVVKIISFVIILPSFVKGLLFLLIQRHSKTTPWTILLHPLYYLGFILHDNHINKTKTFFNWKTD